MANVIELLENDHRTVDGLFRQIEGTQEAEARQSFFAILTSEFDAHASAEELAVYPKLEAHRLTEDVAEHSYDEHAEARELIAKIERMDPATTDWLETVQKLKKEIKHHVKEEEHNMFPKMRKLFSENQLEKMGEEVEAAKQKVSKAA